MFIFQSFAKVLPRDHKSTQAAVKKKINGFTFFKIRF
jgi:hypothetical protein